MRKWLAIFGLVLLSTGIVTIQGDEDSGPSQLPTKQHQPALHPPDTKNGQADPDSGQTQTNSNTPTGNASLKPPKIWWRDPNWWLVIVAALTGGVIFAQSREMGISTRAMNDSIRLQEADLRPWLLVKIKKSLRPCLLDNGLVRFTWTVKNVGKTPARILEEGARISLDTIGPEMNEIPDYGTPKVLDGQILVPGETIAFPVFWSVTEDGKERYKLGKSLAEFNDLAVIFGYVAYRAAFDSEGRYITRFCVAGSIIKGKIQGEFTFWEFAGPKYTEST